MIHNCIHLNDVCPKEFINLIRSSCADLEEEALDRNFQQSLLHLFFIIPHLLL